MFRKLSLIVLIFQLTACAELQEVVNQLPQGGGVSQLEIASGLRQALDFGIDKQVSKLALKDGFCWCSRGSFARFWLDGGFGRLIGLEGFFSGIECCCQGVSNLKLVSLPLFSSLILV